jgi:hypothetical protein
VKDAPTRLGDAAFQPEIRRGRLDRLAIYEVSESELVVLERGSPGSVYLSFAIFLPPSAICLSATLLLTTIPSDRIFLTFVAVTTVGYVVGGVLLALCVGIVDRSPR